MMLDTSGLFAFVNAAESRHEKAADLFVNAADRVTHSLILAELSPLAIKRKYPTASVLALIDELIVDTSIDVVWVDEQLTREGMDLLRARPDKEYSLCDAVSFVLMYRRGIYESLTTDHHFEQEGFVALLK